MAATNLKTYLKQTQETKFVIYITILTSIAFILSACSSGFDTQKVPYIYKDPSQSSNPVDLKPAYEPPVKIKTATMVGHKVEFKNAKGKVDKNKIDVEFRVDITINDKNEIVNFRGRLVEDQYGRREGWMQQANVVTKKFYAFASCMGESAPDICSKMYFNVYYIINGKTQTKQFLAHPGLSPLVENTINKNAAGDRYAITSEPTTPIIEKPKENSPLAAQESEEFDHGDEPIAHSEENIYYIPPELPEEYKAILISAEPTTEEKISLPTEVIPEIKPVDKRKDGATAHVVSARPPADDQADQMRNPSFSFTLREGGTAWGSPSNGRILDRGTLMNRKGPSHKRVSTDNKAYATGYLTDFLIESSKIFTTENKECGELTFNNLSKINGGKLNFNQCGSSGNCSHRTHQNGLDVDTIYLTNPGYVVRNGKIISDFNYKCNYNYMKLISNIELPNGLKAVSRIYVHQVVKKSFCEYAKYNNFNSEEDRQLFETLYSTNGSHANHFHINMTCSPEHPGCQQNSIKDGQTCNL